MVCSWPRTWAGTAAPMLRCLPRTATKPTANVDQVGWTASENAPCVDAVRYMALADVAVTGYFQSRRFFSTDVLQAVAALVDLEAWQSVGTQGLDDLFAAPDSVVVSLHIRRGDYMPLSRFHPLQSAEYYTAALRLVPQTAAVLVFSDDLPWARRQPWLAGCRADVRFPDLGREETLVTMARCSHHIIANSSFSWWGAQLATARCLRALAPPPTVIAPGQWFGPANAHLNTAEVADDHWLVVDQEGCLVGPPQI